jgi:DNA polymerase-1
MSKVTYDTHMVIERWGVPPRLMADMLAIVGDAADNVKGVPGLGPTKAAKILNRYGSLDEMKGRLEEMPDDLTHRLLVKHFDAAEHAYKLVRLGGEHAIDIALKDWTSFQIREPNVEALTAFFDEMEIVKLRAEVIERWGVAS